MSAAAWPRRSPRRRAVAMSLGLAVACCLTPASGRAGEGEEQASRYSRKGKKLYAQGKYDDAIVAFELAYKAAAVPRYLFNLGRCHERKGDLYTAMGFIERYVEAVADPAEKQDAQETAEILRGKLLKTSGELTVRSTPAGAGVVLRGARDVTGRTPLKVWLQAGTWELEVAKDGFAPDRSEVSITVGEAVRREFELTAEAAGAAPEAPVAEPITQAPPASDDASGPQEAGLGWGAVAGLSAGAALLAGGALFGLMAKSADDDLDAMKGERRPYEEVTEQHDLATGRQGIATALTIGGVVAAGVGVGLALLGPPEEAVVTVGPGSLGLSGNF